MKCFFPGEILLDCTGRMANSLILKSCCCSFQRWTRERRWLLDKDLTSQIGSCYAFLSKCLTNIFIPWVCCTVVSDHCSVRSVHLHKIKHPSMDSFISPLLSILPAHTQPASGCFLGGTFPHTVLANCFWYWRSTKQKDESSKVPMFEVFLCLHVYICKLPCWHF
jgi:hypothetical protein